ncbi:formylglycine-generating enzyme family protein [Roseomonas sp. F4]
MMRKVILMAAAMLGLMALPARSQEPAPDWNPRPAPEGDLVLSLPCGQGLVFRRVLTPLSSSLLADRRAILGDEDAESPFFEFVREAFVAGNFGSEAEVHYWIGKYEVTAGQYTAVIRGCEALHGLSPGQRRLPQTNLSWFDAIRFTEAATRHVLRDPNNAMPAERGVRGFLRLPTEAEWEYAVRGGATVSDAEFRGRLPPMEGPVTNWAQLRRTGTRSSPVPVGLLQPDRLGLYDMLGNAEEMVMDPFRLTRGGRAGGRAGGLVTRGGDINIAPDRIRTSQRVERAPFRPDGTPTSLPSLGFRMAIGLPVVVDNSAIARLRSNWEEEVGQAGPEPGADPRRMVQQLEQAAVDPAERQRLAALRAAVEGERAARVQSEERGARSAIGAGAALIRVMRTYHHTGSELRAELRNAGNRPNPVLRETIASMDSVRDSVFTILASLVLQQVDTPQALVEAQLQVWRQEATTQPGFDRLRDFATMFAAEVEAARTGRSVPREEAYRRLLVGIPD